MSSLGKSLGKPGIGSMVEIAKSSPHLALVRELFPGQAMLDVDQIAALTRYSKGHIYNLASTKKLPFKIASGLGDKILVSVIEIANYLDSSLLSHAQENDQSEVEEPPQKRKPGRPRGSSAASLQMQCFQAELKTSIYQLEFVTILGEIQSTTQSLVFDTEGSAEPGDQLNKLKAEVIYSLVAVRARLARIAVDLLVPTAITD
jgi:hypothetical protein